jgi:hypothetical protein
VKPLTKNLGKIFRAWSYFCGVCGLLFVGFIILAEIRTRNRNADFDRRHLFPVVGFIEHYRETNNCLPNENEVQTWAKVNLDDMPIWFYTNRPDFLQTWGSNGKDYLVGVWRGEWIQYYSSWDKMSFSQ